MSHRVVGLHAAAVCAWLGSVAALASPVRAGDEEIPPTEKIYRAEIVDAETGAPVPGVTLRAEERILQYYCAEEENGQCSACQGFESEVHRFGASGPDGKVELVFLLPHCAFVSDSPPLWEHKVHQSWGPPVVVAGGAIDDPWILGSYEWIGSEEIDHRVRVTKESRLAERFAPVLHRHRGRELQADLADIERSIADHASIRGFDVTGRSVLDEDPPPLHLYVDHAFDTYGQGTQQIYLVLDFDDAVLHAGAPEGGRPLYTHVFPHGDGIVVQYWLWLQGNDLTQLPGGAGCHEGDWEYLAIYAELEGSEWVPRQVNLSQHEGGQSLPADEAWWSETAAPTYAGLAQGFSSERTHPHVWVAANSHALYNRFDPVYEIRVEIPPLCDVRYADRVDYNRGNNPNGDHGFFVYDQILPMGEFQRVGEAHGENYIWHWEGGPLEPLMFVGRYGEGHCVDLPDCVDYCGVPELSYTHRAPLSPLFDVGSHLWSGFAFSSGRWGNGAGGFASVAWRDVYLLGDYLGEVATCADGTGERLCASIPALGTVAATARFTRINGDVVIHEADTDGELFLGAPLDGAYRMEVARISGSGEMRLDVEGEGGFPLAVDLRFDVVPHACSDPAETPEGPGVAGDAASRPRFRENPSRAGFRFDLGGGEEGRWSHWSLHDPSGRRVASGPIAPRDTQVAWSSAGSVLAPGRYFLRLTGSGETVSAPLVLLP